jgi:uncharacterized phage protein gp47/JayE
MSRTVEQILEDIKIQFRDTPLETAANNTGNLYALMRGMALTCFNQEQVIQQIIDTKLVSTVSGTQLDLYANNYGLVRRAGTSAFGSVIIKSSTQLSIPIGTLLQTNNGFLTFQTTKAVNIPINKEITVPIVSITKSFDANLFSQVSLTSPNFPQLTIVVGEFRNTDNQIVGYLSGGSSSESDESLRGRLSTYINNKGVVTLPTIKAIIQNYVSDVYFVEGRPAAGYTSVYINTSDQLTIDLLSNKLEEIKPLGVLLLIKSIQYQSIDLSIDVIIDSFISDSITTISNNIKQAVNIYFSNLSIGETLIINELSSFISSYTGYRNKIAKPTTNISPLINEYLLKPNEVTINVKSK